MRIQEADSVRVVSNDEDERRVGDSLEDDDHNNNNNKNPPRPFLAQQQRRAAMGGKYKAEPRHKLRSSGDHREEQRHDAHVQKEIFCPRESSTSATVSLDDFDNNFPVTRAW